MATPASATLHALPRAELQRLCKEHGLKANGKTTDLIAALAAALGAAEPAAMSPATQSPPAEAAIGADEPRPAAPQPTPPTPPTPPPSPPPRCLVHGPAPAGVPLSAYTALVLVGGHVTLAGRPFRLQARLVPLAADGTGASVPGYVDNLLCAACVADNNAALAAPVPIASAPAALVPAPRAMLASAHGPVAGPRSPRFAGSPLRPLPPANARAPPPPPPPPPSALGRTVASAKTLATGTASPRIRRQRGETFEPGTGQHPRMHA